MILIWIVGFLGAILVHFLTRYQNTPPTCFIDYPYGHVLNVIYYLLFLIAGYLVPIIIMMYCYVWIFRKLTVTSPISLQTLSQSNCTSTNRSVKAVKFMLIITCVYMMLILPFISWMVGLSLANQTPENLTQAKPYFSVLLAIAFSCSYFFCILNPLLFLISDKNIKSNLSRTFAVITCN